MTFILTCLLSFSAPAASEQPSTLQIGAAAPDFQLPGVDGKVHKLADFAGADVLVVIFTCNHCPTAQAYEARIKKLVEDYKGKSVSVVAISPNDPLAVRLDELGYTDLNDALEDMKVRARDAAFNFPYLYDGDTQAASRAYGAVATPHVFVFDSERTLRYQGRFDDSEKPNNIKRHDTRNAIEALLAGREVPVPTTQPFGCSVKWASKRASAVESVKNWDREPVKLSPLGESQLAELAGNNSGKLRLISIWATWSGPSVANLAELVTINRMYRKRDFELINVCVDRAARMDQALAALTKARASYANYLCDGGDLYGVMQAVDPQLAGGVPYTLLVKPGGQVIYRKVGPIEPLELARAVVEHLGRVYP